jgi:hypothetical protein
MKVLCGQSRSPVRSLPGTTFTRFQLFVWLLCTQAACGLLGTLPSLAAKPAEHFALSHAQRSAAPTCPTLHVETCSRSLFA